jgi:hypothetical protein
VLSRIFGYKVDKITGGKRKLRHVSLHNIDPYRNILKLRTKRPTGTKNVEKRLEICT